jgi:hypothetical protein
MERERQVLEREYKIREKGQDREHELNREILGMQKQHLESQTGDQLFNMIQTFVKEASKGLERVCELKKLEAMTPEAQAAAVARGSVDGNVLNGPVPEKPDTGQTSASLTGARRRSPRPAVWASKAASGPTEQPAGLMLFRDITGNGPNTSKGKRRLGSRTSSRCSRTSGTRTRGCSATSSSRS